MVRLGDYIEECDKRNGDLALKLDDIRGVSIEKKFIATKANMDGVSLIPYKVVEPGWFCYVTVTSRNSEKISLAYYGEKKPAIVSSSYIVFRSKDEEQLLPEYLYLFLCRPEFDRYARFNSWGSARETFDFSELCRTEIPLPSLDTQRELVAIYDGLKKIVAENEALIKLLEEACRAFVVECKRKYSKDKLGKYILEYDQKNSDNKIKEVRSVSVSKEFKETNAKVDKNELRGYKLVPPDHIAYVQTTKNEKCFANALNLTQSVYVVSAVDRVITTKEADILDIGFLHLTFINSEFDRYAIFNSWGSAREIFSYDELCSTAIPIPPIEVQRAGVAIFQCLDNARKIIQETRARMKNLCPALVQKAVHSA